MKCCITDEIIEKQQAEELFKDISAIYPEAQEIFIGNMVVKVYLNNNMITATEIRNIEKMAGLELGAVESKGANIDNMDTAVTFFRDLKELAKK
jgi:hypothetical protein